MSAIVIDCKRKLVNRPIEILMKIEEKYSFNDIVLIKLTVIYYYAF